MQTSGEEATVASLQQHGVLAAWTAVCVLGGTLAQLLQMVA